MFINYGPNFFPAKTEEKEEEVKPTLSPTIQYPEDASSDSTYFEDSDLD